MHVFSARAVTGSSGGSNASANQVWPEATLGSEVHKSNEDRRIPEVHTHSHIPGNTEGRMQGS